MLRFMDFMLGIHGGSFIALAGTKPFKRPLGFNFLDRSIGVGSLLKLARMS